MIMDIMDRRWTVVLMAACLLLVGPAWGQFGGPAPTPSVPPVKGDLPYIRCGVCEALAKNAYRQVKAAKDKLKPGKKVSALPLPLYDARLMPLQCQHGIMHVGGSGVRCLARRWVLPHSGASRMCPTPVCCLRCCQ